MTTMKTMTMTKTLCSAAAVTMLLAATALAATPAQNCESRKNEEAGRYLKCRQKAEAKLALRSNRDVFTLDLQKCASRYGTSWPRIEGNAGGACPSTGDQTAIQQYLDIASGDVASALAGDPLAGQGHRLKTGQTSCWGESAVPTPCPGSGRDGEHQKGLDRNYVDNGDGTITDVRTGLMWEKLSDDGSIHDIDNDYTWGDAYSYKLAGLNAIAFAGYTDWRLPNVNELQTLLNYGVNQPTVSPAFQAGCVPGCSVLTCSCAWRVGYTHGIFWTSSTYQSAPFYLWTVGVSDGSIGYEGRNEVRHARAVRGGS
jgi:hypothetical protein